MSVKQILNIGESRQVKNVQESGRILRRVVDSNRTKSVHDLRQELGGKLETLDFINEDQQNTLKLILGEALTNACCYTLDQRPIEIAWESSPSDLQLRITNSNRNHKSQLVALPEDCLSEHGRGIVLIEELAKCLVGEAGLHTGCSLCSSFNRTVFRINIGF
ncbi:MAG: ATP-binding protein [Patescibacteria group bacterium]|nr:ATP-binding protein [Patescibacteria group bacterium]